MSETKTAPPEGDDGQALGPAPAPVAPSTTPAATTVTKKEARKDKTPKASTVKMAEGEIEIFPTRPLPEFNGFHVQAFEADDKRISGNQMAFLCGRSYAPRITYGGSYKNIKSTALLRLLDVNVVNWTDGRQYLAYIFDRPNGRKFLSTPDGRPLHVSEDKLVSVVIQPVIQLLAELRNVDMVHGGINLENMYLVGAEGSEAVILGECLTSAPSARQHAIYEPIARAMAQPMGRGPGRYKDDLYAFGMCVAMIARGVNLTVGSTPQQIIANKIETGSASMAIGGERLPSGVAEFLRGVLNDDEAQRWDIEDAIGWCEGRRNSPKQPRVPVKAARPYIFMDKKYWELRALAEVFSQHIAEAATDIEGDQFELWVKRNFEDKMLEKRLEKLFESEKMSGRDKLVSRVCMALDPHAPIRFRKLHIYPEGFGDALTEAFAKGEDMQIHGDFLMQQIVNAWINLRHEEIADSSNILSTFEKCRNFLTQKIAGYGLERALYTLNAEVACLSPMLKNHMVFTPGHLLQALEDLAAQGVANERILDRHMIAFISVREAKMIDPHLGQVVSVDRGSQFVGMVRTLALIQKRFAVDAVPALGNMLIGMANPAVERILDRDTRVELQKKLDKQRDRGDLTALIELIDDTQQMLEDNQKYLQARLEFAQLQEERLRISDAVKGKKFFGYGTGRQVAMLVSAVFSTIIIVVYVVTKISGAD